MGITLDKQPLPITVEDVEGGDTIAFELEPDRVFLVTDLAQREDGPANCRLIVDLVSGRARNALFTDVCSKVDIAATIA